MESKHSLTGRVNKVSLWYNIAVILIVILFFTYFIAKDLFIEITSWAMVIMLPLLSLLIILSPFIYIWKFKKRWNFFKRMHCAHQHGNPHYGSIFWLGRFFKLHV